ncbi:MAG: redoxin domain-containing protein [Gemmatimonas sp.]
MSIRPRQPAPVLDVPLLSGGRFVLAQRRPQRFTLILFYRGLHCERCKGYLGEIESMLPDFARRGVDVLAVSCDTRERAERSMREWKLSALPVGYGLPIDMAREWGLFISRAVRDDEAPIFAEPGTFLVDAEGRLYFAVINSLTRLRPYPRDIMDAIDRIIETGAEARGEA